MASNPYQPPTQSTEDKAEQPENGSIEPPRYLGNLKTIEGDIGEQKAIRLAKVCKQEPILAERANPPTRKTSWWGITFGLLIVIPMIVVFELNPANQTFVSLITPSMIFSFVIITSLFVVILLILTSINSRRFLLADPPLGGPTKVHLAELGLSLEKQTRDGRVVEVFCGWRQIQAFVSEDAWLLNLAYSSPVLIPRDWIDNQDQRVVFDALVGSIARWQIEQPMGFDLAAIPDESSESFPDYTDGSIQLNISTKAELKARHRIRRKIKTELPDYQADAANTPLLGWAVVLWKLFLFALFVSASWIGFDHFNNHADKGPWRLVALILPQLVFLSVGLWFTFKVSRDITLSGAISATDLWLDQRSLLIRFPLDTLPKRLRVKNTLVLATETGTTAVVLPRSYFQSESAFREAEQVLLGSTTDADPER
ncbi:hypothetical protein LOC67_04535 [Stieleria sp. JC731]|uniref:hypothetical protein n=1 Tax=Pirellulaceae TaxID=2691357 RepID=UPI001E4AE93A|nr:hypothetical protein [Stieleria sp. JC731]MCC9599820.1 hypothetical protein [Stieleria sp. JC731]